MKHLVTYTADGTYLPADPPVMSDQDLIVEVCALPSLPKTLDPVLWA